MRVIAGDLRYRPTGCSPGALWVRARAIGLLPSDVVAVLPSNIDFERRNSRAREAIAGHGG